MLVRPRHRRKSEKRAEAIDFFWWNNPTTRGCYILIEDDTLPHQQILVNPPPATNERNAFDFSVGASCVRLQSSLFSNGLALQDIRLINVFPRTCGSWLLRCITTFSIFVFLLGKFVEMVNNSASKFFSAPWVQTLFAVTSIILLGFVHAATRRHVVSPHFRLC